MDYKVIYRKYRPKNFDEVIGQIYTIQILKNAFLDGKISHANIFTGPRGTGKTSTAKLLAKLLNCENPIEGNPCEKCNSCQNMHDNPDIIEIDAASNNGVEQIRELINNVKIAPSYSKYKVYIIDEVHMLTPNAFNALLLTLEEPPKNIIFILATTEIQNVPITILSRCQRFDFNRIDANTIHEQLLKVVKIENINITDEAIKEISEICDGGMRDAYNILDQISKKESQIEVTDIYKMFGSVSDNSINQLIDNVINNNVDNIISNLEILQSSSTNYITIIDKLIKILNLRAKKCILNKEYELFDLYKELALELAKIYMNKSINKPFLLIEMILLSYCKRENYFPGNNLDSDIIKKNENKFEKKIEKTIINKIEKNDSENIKENIIPNNYLEKLVNVRINNSFVNANKEYKSNCIKTFKKFMEQIDKSLLNIIEDTEIVVASDKYIILMTENESSANLINEDLNHIESVYQKFANNNYKLIAISKEKWNEVKNQYLKKIKNNIEYVYIDEPKLESVSSTVFDSSIIEIK